MAQRQAQVQTATAALEGGLDLVTPALVMKPGRAIAAQNYEPTNSGYRRCDGFERFDGQPRPSTSSYTYLTFVSGSQALLTGQIVTGATSGATGKLLVDGVATSGSYGIASAAGYIVLTAVTGSFVSGENIRLAGVTKAVTSAASIEFGAPDDASNTTWARAAIETARTLIQKVPGAGPLRGVWMYKSVAYAFRDDAAPATKCVMYKATTAGWAVVPLGFLLPFTSGGTHVPIVGEVITGATSAATATLTRVVLTSGTFAGGDAAGYFVFASKTGTFQAENLNIAASLNVATIAGDATANSFAPSGRFEFVNYNFYAASGQIAMYGCDGVSKAFEFDGAVFTPIATGATDDRPLHIGASDNRLCLAFRNGSFQVSIAGSPQIWDGARGAAVFGTGSDIVGILGEILDTVFVICKDKVRVLYGQTTADFDLKTIASESGGIEWSVQNIGSVAYLDQRGLRNTTATQAYGDFTSNTLTEAIQPYLDHKRKNGVTVVSSLRVRSKTQYRVYFSDNSGLVVYLGKSKSSPFGNSYPIPEILTLDLGMVVRCCCSVVDDSGVETLLAGSDDGYVYQLDSGTSFDGAEMGSFFRLAFNACGSPAYDKRWIKCVLEVDKPVTQADTTQNASLLLSADFTYADPDQPAVEQQAFVVTGGGGFWNEANWNEFFYSSAVFGRAEAYIDGFGQNISITVGCYQIYEQPHTVHAYTTQYSMRGLAR